jgi:hypothetical protein
MSQHDDDEYDITESDPSIDGSIGVSSERVGHTGPGQYAPTGVKDTSEIESEPDADLPPEQSPGREEPKPEGLEPKAGYPSLDPRSAD